MNTANRFEFGRASGVGALNTKPGIAISILLLFGAFLSTPCVYAAETPADPDRREPRSSADLEIGIEIGALSLLGTDVRLFFRQADSPWQIGYRFLDIEDDFVNEAVVGLPGDDSDKEFTRRSGPYVTYLFDPTGSQSYYLAGALFKAETKVVCSSVEVSDSDTGVYFGGGFRRKWNANLGFNIGLMISPGADLAVESPTCSSESDGDFDLNASLIFSF